MEARGRGRRLGSKNYSREFRKMVASEANHPKRSISEVAKEQGLNANMVSKWRREQASRAQQEPLAAVPEQSFLPVHIASLFTQRSAVIVERGDPLKVLWWSGDGMCLLMKRLGKGRFIWPQATSGTVYLSPAQLSMLLEGIDWRQPTRTAQPISAL